MRWWSEPESESHLLPEALLRRTRATRRRVGAAALALVVLSGFLIGIVLLHERAEIVQAGRRSIHSLAHIVAEQTTRSLQTVDQALELSAVELNDLAEAGRLDQAAGRLVLLRRLQHLPYLRAMSVLDEHGVVVHASDAAAMGENHSGSDHFAAFASGRERFYVGRPVQGGSGTWLISAARPLSIAGAPGVIVAAVEHTYFDDLWRTVDLGKAGSIALVRGDGTLLLRSPLLVEAIGRKLPQLPAEATRADGPPAGSYDIEMALDGIERLASYRRLPFPDLLVVVTESQPVLLGPWREFAALTVLTWLFAVAIGAVLCARLLREHERRRLSEARSLQSQKLEAIGTLAAGIAHDFNNILGGILGNVVLARDTRDAQRSLEEIQKAALRGRELVRQILAFSRGQTKDAVDVELGPLVEEAASLLRATLPAGVEIRLVLPEAPVAARADGSQMHQLLVNLATNAWHALEGGHGCIEIGVESEFVDDIAVRGLGVPRAGQWVRVWVRDTGTGIDAANLERIFDPFYTTKAEDRGSGMGLAVVRRIVDAHGGAVHVETQLGRGSTFHVWLPPGDASAVPHAEAGTAGPVVGRGQHVLCVDDDDMILLMVDRLLTRHGFRVTTSASPRAAVDAVRRRPAAYDVVVTDSNMPELSGIEVAARVRALRSDLPVLLSSGYVSADLREQAHRAGVDEIVHKEDAFAVLPQAVERALGRTSTEA